MRKYFGWKAIILRRVPFINFQTVIRVIIFLSLFLFYTMAFGINDLWPNRINYTATFHTKFIADTISLASYGFCCGFWSEQFSKAKWKNYRIVNPKKPYFPSLKMRLESAPKSLMFIESIRLFLLVHLKVYLCVIAYEPQWTTKNLFIFYRWILFPFTELSIN